MGGRQAAARFFIQKGNANMRKQLLQWLRRTPALWLLLAVELVVVAQAAWSAVQPPLTGC